MKKMYIYIRQGNNVYLDDKLIGKFNNFDLAWTFASQLSQLIESQGIGLDCTVFTQGGTWLTEKKPSVKSYDAPIFNLEDVPF